MEDQGGNKIHDENRSSLDPKIIVTVVFSMVLGALFVIGLVVFGLSANDSTELPSKSSVNSRADKESIIEIISLDHEDQIFSYSYENADDALSPAKDDSKSSDSDQNSPTILDSPDGSTVAQKADRLAYRLIDKKADVDDIIAAINGYNNGADSQVIYDIDADFFTSGSILAIAYEDPKLTELTVDALNRDADYNITAEVAYRLDANLTTSFARNGRLILVKIGNVQPKNVDVKVTSKAS